MAYVVVLTSKHLFLFVFLNLLERLLLNHAKTLGFLTSRGEEFDLGPVMRFDHSELFITKFY